MFQKKSAGHPRTTSAKISMAGSTFSVLGADTAIKGDLSASADLHVDGKVEGDILDREGGFILSGNQALERAGKAGLLLIGAERLGETLNFNHWHVA